jgi:hypothetical protein
LQSTPKLFENRKLKAIMSAKHTNATVKMTVYFLLKMSLIDVYKPFTDIFLIMSLIDIRFNLSVIRINLMGKVILAVVVALMLIFVPQTTMAAPSIWACNANGVETNSFYTNDTVYACGENLTADASGYVDIYIVTDTSSWPANTTLNDVSIGYQTFTTNSTGDLPPTSRWPSPTIGYYDVVADVDRNGIYNSTDYVDSTSNVGFTIEQQPLPTLTFALGPDSPSAHDWDLVANQTENIMMQLKVTAYENEDIMLNGITLTASGTGDDKTGVKYIKLVKDVEGDGVLNSTDTLLAFEYYLKDNGIAVLTLDESERIILGNSTYFFITYMMDESAQVGDTFSFQVTDADATGSGSGIDARINGLPFDSYITTITGTATTTTTLPEGNATTTTSSTTTTTAITTTTTVEPEGGILSSITDLFSGELNYFIIIGIVGIIVLIIAIVLYFKLLKKENKVKSYEEVEEKWEV